MLTGPIRNTVHFVMSGRIQRMASSDPQQSKPGWAKQLERLELLSYIDKWRQRIRTYPETGLPLKPSRPSGDDSTALSIEELAFRTGRGLRIALACFAPVCASVFLLSFLLDEGLLRNVVRSVSIAGLIGFGTNWVAIKMLFWPRSIRPVFGQGLIPTQRDAIIVKVADEVVDKLINEQIIRRELDDSRLISRLTEATVDEIRRLVRTPEFVDDSKRMVLTYASLLTDSEEFRTEVLNTAATRVESYGGKALSSWFVGRLRGVWYEPLMRIVQRELDDLPETIDGLIFDLEEVLERLPRLLEEKQEKIDAGVTRIVMGLIREVDVRGVILKQLSEVTSVELEKGFRDFADDKLSFITLLGGLLGLVGGLVIVWPLQSLLAIFALACVLTLVDVIAFSVLVRRRRGYTDDSVEVSGDETPLVSD